MNCLQRKRERTKMGKCVSWILVSIHISEIHQDSRRIAWLFFEGFVSECLRYDKRRSRGVWEVGVRGPTDDGRPSPSFQRIRCGEGCESLPALSCRRLFGGRLGYFHGN